MNGNGNEQAVQPRQGNDRAQDDNDDPLVFFDTVDHPSTPSIVQPQRTKAELDPGGIHINSLINKPLEDCADNENIFVDAIEEQFPIMLQLDHARLESETTADRFLNHLNYETLTGLQHRLSPIEYAIHAICTRSQRSLVNDGQLISLDTTVTTDNQTPQGTPPAPTKLDATIDKETLPQTAPTCVIAKHKEEDPEKL